MLIFVFYINVLPWCYQILPTNIPILVISQFFILKIIVCLNARYWLTKSRFIYMFSYKSTPILFSILYRLYSVAVPFTVSHLSLTFFSVFTLTPFLFLHFNLNIFCCLSFSSWILGSAVSNLLWNPLSELF